MKYYITSSFEIDGHSSSMSIICDTVNTKSKYLKEILTKYDGAGFYPTEDITIEDNGSKTMRGRWECGLWSINILPFKSFRDIINKENYVRTD